MWLIALECLSILVKRQINSQDIIDNLFHLSLFKGIPEHVRSNSRSESIANTVRIWLNQLDVKILFIEPEDLNKVFNGKLKHEFLNRKDSRL